MIDLRFPNISADTPEGQLAQIKSAMMQLTEQLNYAFSSISNGESMAQYVNKAESAPTPSASTAEGTNNTFSDIKSIIIKSADIVKHIRDEVVTLFEQNETYVAHSKFGDYFMEQYAKQEAFPDALNTIFYTKEEIDDTIGKRLEALENDAVIKQGALGYFKAGEYEGVKQYGIEIGQKVTNDDGEEVYNKMARLSAEGLELFASTDSKEPIAIFKNDHMYISNAVITGTLKLGGYNVETHNGLSFKWVGR